MWSTNFHKSFFKNVLFYTNYGLWKTRSVHTHVLKDFILVVRLYLNVSFEPFWVKICWLECCFNAFWECEKFTIRAFEGEQISEQLSNVQFLQDLKFPRFSTCFYKGEQNTRFSNYCENLALERCSNLENVIMIEFRAKWSTKQFLKKFQRQICGANNRPIFAPKASKEAWWMGLRYFWVVFTKIIVFKGFFKYQVTSVLCSTEMLLTRSVQ